MYRWIACIPRGTRGKRRSGHGAYGGAAAAGFTWTRLSAALRHGRATTFLKLGRSGGAQRADMLPEMSIAKPIFRAYEYERRRWVGRCSVCLVRVHVDCLLILPGETNPRAIGRHAPFLFQLKPPTASPHPPPCIEVSARRAASPSTVCEQRVGLEDPALGLAWAHDTCNVRTAFHCLNKIQRSRAPPCPAESEQGVRSISTVREHCSIWRERFPHYGGPLANVAPAAPLIQISRPSFGTCADG